MCGVRYPCGECRGGADEGIVGSAPSARKPGGPHEDVALARALAGSRLGVSCLMSVSLGQWGAKVGLSRGSGTRGPHEGQARGRLAVAVAKACGAEGHGRGVEMGPEWTAVGPSLW